MKQIIIITIIVVGLLGATVSQSNNHAMSKDKKIENIQRVASDPGTG